MDIRQFFFKNRSYTPIPLVFILIYFAQPTFFGILLGLVIILIGESIRIYANRFAGGATRTTKVGAKKLCASGPFAYVRNPLYVGNMVIYTGVVLFTGAPSVISMMILTWAFFVIQYSLIVSLEEETLRDLFGEEYRVYCTFVPRLLPRLSAWENDDNRVPASISKTFKVEKRTLQNIALILIIILLRSIFF